MGNLKVSIKNEFKNLMNRADNLSLRRRRYFGKYSFKQPFDKLFILGSGLTINELTESQFNHINQYSSVAVNFFMVHPFRPNFYFIEISRNHEDREMYFHNLSLRSDFDQIDKFYCFRKEDDGLDERLTDLFDPARLYSYSLLKMGNYGRRFNYQKLLSKYYHTKFNNRFFTPQDYFDRVLNNVSSIERLCQFGLQGGAKEIIFCGVDLNKTDCFYDSADFIPYLDFKIPYRRYKDKKVHTTNDKSEVNFTVEEFLISLTELVDTKFYVSSANSKLSNFMPVYDFGENEQ